MTAMKEEPQYFKTSDGLKLAYEVDDFTDPWRKADTLILIHAAMGSTRRLYAWVPTLSRDFRVVRLDMRGHGQSAIPGEGQLSLERRARVPMNDQAHAALCAAAEIRTTDNVIEFRGRPVKSLKKGLAETARLAGVEGVTPHVLRHTAATWMVQDGRPDEETARYLGTTAAMVQRVYGHHSPDFLKAASQALEF